MVAVIVISAAWGALSLTGVIKLICQCALGLIFVHMIELQHELLHGLGIKNGWVNKIIGYILGLPMLVMYADYQYNHINHHKYLGTPQNKEFFDYNHKKFTILSF